MQTEEIETGSLIAKAKPADMEQAAKNIQSFVSWTQKDKARELLSEAFTALFKDRQKDEMLKPEQIEDIMFDLQLLQSLVDALHTLPIIYRAGEIAAQTN